MEEGELFELFVNNFTKQLLAKLIFIHNTKGK